MTIINSSNNSTKVVSSHGDLAKLAKLAMERDLLVISNEVYEKITHDDARHFCLTTFSGM